MADPTLEIIPLADLVGGYGGIVLDVFGVIHDGMSVFPEAYATLGLLRKEGIRICLLSNSPRRSDEVAKRLEAMGIGRELYHGLITSGELVYEALTESPEFPAGSTYFHLGPVELAELLSALPMNASMSIGAADFILTTGWPEEDAMTSKLLHACIARKLPMICANPDFEVLIGARKVICAGALARDYEMLGGRVISYGKPYRTAYSKALEVLCLTGEQVLAIGDSVATDIVGGRRAGLDTALVLTGVHKNCLTRDGKMDRIMLRDLFRQHSVAPDFILSSLG
ncbi:TIGR01459 family HAD-type hydrolase [Rhizobium viscosum]|uniref:HAD superfamily hydrolase (TIGR01459 family) n=1 Tax=Rhizobium viscosum TaxID=1673 RepID=A0ABR9IZV5_RHIVS|nr:TIGR01459 family HAD-type hydrolase [Rhizobium viscosum]MBE1508749.1 HAD superfamily hydrolase (TIGR01459 family) [Rhizobium viscosum]